MLLETKARQLVHSRFNAERWEYHEITGTDRGLDCIIELVENEQWGNKKIERQTRGTRKLQKLKNKNVFSFPLDVKNVNYGLGSNVAFVLFLVDVDEKRVYYLPLQDYFISDLSLFDRSESDQDKMNLHIPCDNIVSDDDFERQQIAKSIYVDGRSINLRKI